MILEDKTKEIYNYIPQELTLKSRKPIICSCDYCGQEFEIKPYDRIKKLSVINKDNCKDCKNRKKNDIYLKKFGVKNIAQRPDVKDKIKNTNLEKYGVENYASCDQFKIKVQKTCMKKYGQTSYTKTKEYKNRVKQTCLEKYGVESHTQLQKTKEKIANTNIKKYGVKCTLQSKKIQKQSRITSLEKFGTEYPSQSEEFKNKIKKTSLKKYGTEYSVQAEEVINKKKQTNLSKYGNEEYLASDIGKQQVKLGCMDKYGVENPFQANEIKCKIKNTNLSKYGVEHLSKIPNECVKRNIKANETKKKLDLIYHYKNQTIPELAKKQGFSRSHFGKLVKKYGFENALEMNPKRSYLEKIFQDILDSSKIEYKMQFCVENRYADFYLPAHNLLIELDGLYWHSELICKDKNYHSKKKDLYLQNGYKSLFFRENEINNSLDICKSILFNKIGKSGNIYARKCEIRPVDKQIAKQFFNTNHLMGAGSGNSLGLYYFDELVCCMQIRRIKDNDYDISRFCTKKFISVTGGFSKLLKHIPNNISSLRCFVDRRYGYGEYLLNMGFIKKSCHTSFKWTNTKEVFNRMQFPSNSGYKNNLTKIWDCGQINYTKIY